jgi:hypothetical protein
LPKVFWQKKIGNIGTFGNMGTKINFFVQKMKKRVSVGNDVICQTIFQFYKEVHDRFERRESPKSVECNSSNAIN